MRSCRSFIFAVSCWILLSSFCAAQSDTTKIRRDTAIVASPARSDTLRQAKLAPTGKPFRSTKSAWLAVGLSAVLPGAGQLYNENYWKVPVIWGLTGYWIYEWVKLNNQYKDFGDQYDVSISTLSPGGNAHLRGVRDFYRDERDKFAWYLGGLYFLNLVDAYVGAHLYDFDISPDLGAGGRLVPGVTATIRMGF